jgi:molybdate transport system substrate-binding protein
MVLPGFDDTQERVGVCTRRSRRKIMRILPALFAAAIVAGSIVPTAAFAADKTALTVLVASVARRPIEDIIPLYEKAHPNISVQAVYGGGNVMAGQAAAGSGDVIFSNNQSLAPVMAKLGTLVPLFRVHEAVIVPKGSTKVKTLKDLANPGVRIGMVVASAPAGIYSRGVLKAANAAFGADFETKVLANVTSAKTSDGAIVDMIAAGTLDAAIGHPTDASDKIEAIAIPASYDIPASESVASAAPVKTSAHISDANDFIAFLTTPAAQAIFKKHNYDTNVK